MGYVFQFGATAHKTIKRVHHYYVRLFLTILPLLVANSSTRDGFVCSLWSCEFWGVFFKVYVVSVMHLPVPFPNSWFVLTVFTCSHAQLL